MAVSKMVINRQKSSLSVQAANQTHAHRIAKSVAEQFGAEFEEPLVKLLGKMHHALGQVTTTLVAKDEAHQNELGDDAAPRAQRDASAANVRASLVGMKEVLGANMGQPFLTRLGLTGDTPEDPVALERLAAQVHQNLHTVHAPAPVVEDFAFKPEKFRARLEQHLPALSKAIQDVARESKEADEALSEKNKALAAHDATFAQVANLTSALLEFAGEKELAGKVRPSSRRPGQTTEVANQEPTPA